MSNVIYFFLSLTLYYCFPACLAPSLNKSAVGLVGHLLQEQVRITAGHWTGWEVYSWFEREIVTLETLVFASQLLKYAA